MGENGCAAALRGAVLPRCFLVGANFDAARCCEAFREAETVTGLCEGHGGWAATLRTYRARAQSEFERRNATCGSGCAASVGLLLDPDACACHFGGPRCTQAETRARLAMHFSTGNLSLHVLEKGETIPESAIAKRRKLATTAGVRLSRAERDWARACGCGAVCRTDPRLAAPSCPRAVVWCLGASDSCYARARPFSVMPPMVPYDDPYDLATLVVISCLVVAAWVLELLVPSLIRAPPSSAA
jgi:hypothetical protein